jgi:hypothetical protein
MQQAHEDGFLHCQYELILIGKLHIAHLVAVRKGGSL